MRGKLDSLGWLHYDIPIATCHKCKHKIYHDEEYEKKSFVDTSGNNDHEFWHKQCPRHHLEEVMTVTHLRCTDCGVTMESADNA